MDEREALVPEKKSKSKLSKELETELFESLLNHPTAGLMFARHSVGNMSCCASSGGSEFRFFVMTSPAFENRRSLGTDVAGTQRSCLASAATAYLIPPYNNRQHSFNSLAVEPLTAASLGAVAYFKLAAAILLRANRCMHIDGCHKHITGNSGYRVSALQPCCCVLL